MESVFQNRSLAPFAIGAAVAAFAGSLLGGSMQPDLQEGAPTGPRTLIAGGGPRHIQPVSDPGVAVYKGRLPDYVVGSDATHLAELEPEPEYDTAYESGYEPVDDYQPVVAVNAEVATPSAPRAQLVSMPVANIERPNVVIFPSSAGGVVHESDLPAAPPPPEDTAPG